MIDELDNAGNEHLDPEYVAAYDRKAGFDPTDDIAVLQSLGMDAQSTVIDMGAGTGTFALAVAPHVRRVVAVDVSQTMLAILERQIRQTGDVNVEAIQAGMMSYKHSGDPAGFVYSRNTLHHLPDFWKALALHRIAGALEPGGILLLHDLIYSCEPEEAPGVIERWLDGAAGRPDEGFTRDDLTTHIREEYSTFSWLLEPMLKRAGFEILEARHRPSQTYSAYVCRRLPKQ